MTSPSTMRSRGGRILLWSAGVLLVLLAGYAAAGFLLAPWLLQRHAGPWLEERLGRKVSVGEFRANPFLLTVEARDVVVGGGSSGPGEPSAPMVAAGRLVADASLPGVLRDAVALDELRVEGLRLHAVLRPDGTLDLIDAARHWASTAPADTGPSKGFVLEQLDVPDAQVTFTDRSGAQPAQAVIGPVTLQAHGLSTLDQRQGDVRLSASLPEGGSFDAQSDLSLQPAVQGRGRLTLRGLQAGTLWPFVQAHTTLAGLKGTFAASAQLAFGADGALQLSDLSVDANGVRLARIGADPPLLQAERIHAGAGSADFAGKSMHVGELVVADGAVRAARGPDGGLDWTGLSRSKPGPGAVPRTSSGEDTPAWSVEVASLQLQRLDIAYADRASRPGLDLQARQLSVAARVLARSGGQPSFELKELAASTSALSVDAGATQLRAGPARVQGGHMDLASRELGAASLRVEGGQATVASASGRATQASAASPAGASKADAWHVYLDSLQVAGFGGRLLPQRAGETALVALGAVDGSLQLDLRFGGPQPQVVASGIEVQVQDVALAVPGEQPLRVAKAQVGNGRLDLAGRKLGAERIVVSGSATLVRDERGMLVLPAVLAGGGKTAGRPAAGAAALTPQEGGAWQYAIGHLQVPALQVTLVDRSTRPALQLRGTVQASVRDLASDHTAAFDASLALADGGKLTATGTALPAAGSAKATLTADALPLPPLQPLLERIAAVQLRSGTLSGKLGVTAGGASGAQATGKLSVADLLLNDSVSGERLLAWDRLDAEGVVLDQAARSLVAREITVQGPEARIVVSDNRKLNVAQVIGRDGGAGPGGQKQGTPGQAADAAPLAVAAKPPDKPAFQVDVQRVVLRGGTVDFADHSLVVPFSTTVAEVEGTILDLSSDPSHHAAVEAKGSIAPYGSASVEGSLAPAAPTDFLDLQVRFNNVQVPPLSPYTATFAGRKVRSGKLWLALDYHVQDGRLQGKNDIRLSNFTLGERVEAPNALDVPLDLVVALLSDGDGEIRLSVPVQGELGNAKFSVASAVRQAVGNVLRRVVTAPFRAIASLFGGGGDAGESLAAIGFEPGSAQLRPEQVEKLDALTRALRGRPRLDLVVTAPYDPRQDIVALQQAQARQALANALGQPTGRDRGPGPVAYDDPATRTALERLVREQSGDDAVQAVRQQAAAGDERAVAKALFERLAQAQQVGTEAGRLLAIERARGIAGYLQEQGIDSSRFRTGRIATEQASQDGGVMARLQLAAGDEAR